MIRLHTLGTAAVEIEATGPHYAGKPGDPNNVWTTPLAPRRFALLLYLLLQSGRRAAREELQVLTFPDVGHSNGRHSLREAIYQLRNSGAPIITERGSTFIPEDLVRLGWLSAMHDEALDQNEVEAARGGLLPGYAPDHSEAFVEWYEAFRATAISTLTRRLIFTANVAIDAGRWQFAEDAIRACLNVAPLHHEATLMLAKLLATSGARAEAMKTLTEYLTETSPSTSAIRTPAENLRRQIARGSLMSEPLVAIPQAQSGRGSMGSRVATPQFVGRATELMELSEAFDRARRGEPQCVAVTGEPGMGKTRLLDEFARTVTLKGGRLERIAIQPHDAQRPMGAFVDFVPLLLEAPGALGCAPESLNALRSLGHHRAEDDRNSDARLGPDELEARWSTVFRAVVDLCEAIAAESPLVLVVDDAQWLDSLSTAVIAALCRVNRSAAIMIAIGTRDCRQLARCAIGIERTRTIQLGALDSSAAAAILDEALSPELSTQRECVSTRGQTVDKPNDGDVEDLRSRIESVSGGNPLFLLSLAACSRSEGGRFAIPRTILESFGQRIDRISRRGASVLAACSRLGKHSTLERLTRCLGVSCLQLIESLIELVDAGLLLHTDTSAILAHPLIRESLEARLPCAAIRAVAVSVASILEEDAKQASSPTLWWDAANCWRVAREPGRAISALSYCADHALTIGRPGEAARILEQASGLRPAAPLSIELDERIVRAADAANEFTIVLSAAARLRDKRPSPCHDDIELAEARATISYDHSEAGVADGLVKCVRATDASPAHRLHAATLLLKCADMFGRGDLRAAAIASIARSDLDAVAPLPRLEFELLAASAQADRRKAAEIAREILKQSEVESRDFLKCQRNAATALILGDCPDEGIAALEQTFQASVRRASSRGKLFAAVQLAAHYYDAACIEEADQWVATALAVQRESPDLGLDFELVAIRLEAAISQDAVDEATAILEEATAAGVFKYGNRMRWRHAAELAIRCRRSSPDSQAIATAEDIAANRLQSMTGIREFEVAVAADVFARCGMARAAQQLALGYLKHERVVDRPPSRLLAKAMNRAGVHWVNSGASNGVWRNLCERPEQLSDAALPMSDASLPAEQPVLAEDSAHVRSGAA